MRLPSHITEKDVRMICSHLYQKRSTGSTIELLGIIKRGRSVQKLSACRELGFIETSGAEGHKLTSRGKNVLLGGNNRIQSFREAISCFPAYISVIMRAADRQGDAMTMPEVISHWKENFPFALESGGEGRRSQAAFFFSLLDGAGLGKFTEAKGEVQAQVEFDAESSRMFIRENVESPVKVQQGRSLEKALSPAMPMVPGGGNDGGDTRGSAGNWFHGQQLAPDGSGAVSQAAVGRFAGRRSRGDEETGRLVALVDDADFFLTDDGAAHADIVVDVHLATFRVRDEEFSQLLKDRHYDATSRTPDAGVLKAALNTLEARAAHEGRTGSVSLRVSSRGSRIYLDLCDAQRQAVEIDSDGWRMAKDLPVRFRRTGSMRPLPAPRRDGSIDRLGPFLNVKHDHQFVLAVCWALFVLRGEGPCPVLAISGAAGSGKTTFSNVLRALLDPGAAVPGGPPRTEQALLEAADDSLVLVFDNVSRLSNPISDALCRLGTGCAMPPSAAAADGGKPGLSGRTPIVVNGIHDVVNREDLADRSVFMPLELIPEDRRRPETEFWREFEEARPFILGALLDGVARGMARFEETRPVELPRMADFARFAMACETAFWDEGAFLSAYRESEWEALQMTLDSNPVARGVCELVESNGGSWQGTADELRTELLGGGFLPPGTLLPSPKFTSERLTEAEPHLRMLGFKIERRREGKERRRMIYITKIDASSASSASSASEADGSRGGDAKDQPGAG